MNTNFEQICHFAEISLTHSFMLTLKFGAFQELFARNRHTNYRVAEIFQRTVKSRMDLQFTGCKEYAFRKKKHLFGSFVPGINLNNKAVVDKLFY